MIFQSTPSTRRETKNSVHHATRRTFQSTPSTRRETTQKLIDKLNRMLFQSTPSTRRETTKNTTNQNTIDISIHSLHTEGDTFNGYFGMVFDISIHSLHTEGDSWAASLRRKYLISIHSLHTEGDSRIASSSSHFPSFQSTPSTRRETLGRRLH